MSWKPRFSVRQFLIGTALMALLLVWACKQGLRFQAQSTVLVSKPGMLAQNASDVAAFEVAREVARLTSQKTVEVAVANLESQTDRATSARMLSTVKAESLGLHSEGLLLLSVSANGSWPDSSQECITALDALCESYATGKNNSATVLQTASVANRSNATAAKRAGLIAAAILFFVLYGEALFGKIVDGNRIGQSNRKRKGLLKEEVTSGADRDNW